MADATPFHRFAETCRRLTALDGRHAKRNLAADLLSDVAPEPDG